MSNKAAAYLQRVFAHEVVDVFESLVVIQQVVPANHVHLRDRRRNQSDGK